MEIRNVIESVKAFMAEIFNSKCRILSAVKQNNGWTATCEVIVDEEYTTRKGLGGIVEIFEITLNPNYEITGYELKATKPRVSID